MLFYPRFSCFSIRSESLSIAYLGTLWAKKSWMFDTIYVASSIEIFTFYMSEIILQVEDLGKRYFLDCRQQERYTTLRDAIASSARRSIDAIKNRSRSHSTAALDRGNIQNPDREDFWALKDVSFEIKQGEKVGIIGRNGSGKSTLLKTIARITEPTRGRIRIKGRVASLLEVGTGFHPELTGRENIFLNGAILGMSKAEMTHKFDEIVDFAEVEQFLDLPVKRYSSGMYVRLAFAVAAHLEPEILIVDEVLAVGDAQFQKKCLGKMEEVGNSGRTVLFVSHNMSTIQSLCSRCIFLQKGQAIADASTNSVIPLYVRDTIVSDSFTRLPHRDGKPTIVSGQIRSDPQLDRQKIQIDLEIFAETKQKLGLDVRLFDATGCSIGFGDLGTTRLSQLIDINPSSNLVSFTFPIHQLALGAYSIDLALALPWIEYLDRAENCLSFEVVRPALEEGGSVLSQEWGFGSVEFPLERID